MKRAMPSLDNITWDRLEREIVGHLPLPRARPSGPGGGVRGRHFPTTDGRASWCRRRSSRRPSARPRLPWVLTTGRTLEHWHTGAMTRRASNLDALEPEAFVMVNSRTCAGWASPPATRSRSPRAAAGSR